MSTFKRLTGPQRDTLRALRALGQMVVTPLDVRPLRALQRRGLVRYRRIDGVRHAVLKLNNRELRGVRARTYGVPREHWPLVWAGWNEARLRQKN